MRLVVIAGFVLALAAAACGPDLERDHEGRAGDGEVGAPCDDDTDCIAELICILELPGGACTRLCDADCPGDSLCARATLTADWEIFACAPLCSSDDPCRDGYECVSVGKRSVCSF